MFSNTVNTMNKNEETNFILFYPLNTNVNFAFNKKRLNILIKGDGDFFDIKSFMEVPLLFLFGVIDNLCYFTVDFAHLTPSTTIVDMNFYEPDILKEMDAGVLDKFDITVINDLGEDVISRTFRFTETEATKIITSFNNQLENAHYRNYTDFKKAATALEENTCIEKLYSKAMIRKVYEETDNIIEP